MQSTKYYVQSTQMVLRIKGVPGAYVEITGRSQFIFISAYHET